MDYISREDAIEAITKVARKKFTLADWYEFYLKGMTDAEDSLKALPSADVVEYNTIPQAQSIEVESVKTEYLKPCPFCGDPVVLRFTLKGPAFIFYHKEPPNNCLFTSFIADQDDYDINTLVQAVAAWNRRADNA